MAYFALCLAVMVLGVSAEPVSRTKRDLISDAINSQLLAKSAELQKEAGKIYDTSIDKIKEAVGNSGIDQEKVNKLNEYLNKFNEARSQVVAEMTKPGNFMNGAAQVGISARYLGTIKELAGQLEGYLKSISRTKRDLISDAINSQLLAKSAELQQEAGKIFDMSIDKINEAVGNSGIDQEKVKKLNEYLNKFNEARSQVVAEMTKPRNFMNGAAQVGISARYLGTIKELAGQLEGYLKSIAIPLDARREKRDLISDAINMQNLKQAGTMFQKTQNQHDSAIRRIKTAILLGKHKNQEGQLKLLQTQLEAESNKINLERLQPGVIMNGIAQINLAIKYGQTIRYLVQQVDDILR